MSVEQSAGNIAVETPREFPRAWAFALLGLLGAIYVVLIAAHANSGYVDFGDGNYMYISWRLSQGAVLYRDVLAPQPPMHFVAGVVLAAIGNATGNPLLPFRAFGVIIHLATMLLVYAAAARISGGNTKARGAGVTAAAISMLLPIGFWWSQGYQSEPLEMFFFMLSFLLLIQWKRGTAASAGAVGALAPLTNMTAAPYTLFNMGWLLVRRPRLFLYYAIPVVLVIGGVTLIAELWTGAYLENVILNQVGSFPRKEFLPPGENVFTYALGKIRREGTDVLSLEGGYVMLALLGLLLFSRRGPSDLREYVSFYAFFALCSIIYVSKGGTMDYIFTVGEPFVAILGAYLLHRVWQDVRGSWFAMGWRDLSGMASVLAIIALVLITIAPGLAHSRATLSQRTYELDDYRTQQVVSLMQKHSEPADLVLSPPYYAFLAQRRIAEDYSELFLWSLKYHNERQDGQRGRGVQAVERISDLLGQKKIKFIALDMDQTARIPEIAKAIESNYTPIRDTEFRTLNTRLRFLVPKED